MKGCQDIFSASFVETYFEYDNPQFFLISIKSQRLVHFFTIGHVRNMHHNKNINNDNNNNNNNNDDDDDDNDNDNDDDDVNGLC